MREMDIDEDPRLQAMLADRFGLKAAIETRDLPVYALLVAKGGAKMKQVQVDPFPPEGVLPPPGAQDRKSVV